MCSTESRPAARVWRGVAPLIAGCAILLAPAAAAKTVIIKSIGPSAATYPKGMIVPESARIELRRLDIITLLDPDGTRTFRGPLSLIFPLRDVRYPSRPLLAGFLRALNPSEVLAAFRRARPGAVRGQARRSAVRPSTPPAVDTGLNLWLVDPREHGNVCVPADTVPTIIAPAGQMTLTILPANGTAITLTRANPYLFAWPVERAPVRAGDRYDIGQQAAGKAAMRMIVIDSVSADPSEIALKLIENECDGQLGRLAADSAINTDDHDDTP